MRILYKISAWEMVLIFWELISLITSIFCNYLIVRVELAGEERGGVIKRG